MRWGARQSDRVAISAPADGHGEKERVNTARGVGMSSHCTVPETSGSGKCSLFRMSIVAKKLHLLLAVLQFVASLVLLQSVASLVALQFVTGLLVLQFIASLVVLPKLKPN